MRCVWFWSPTETVGEEEVTLCKVEPLSLSSGAPILFGAGSFFALYKNVTP